MTKIGNPNYAGLDISTPATPYFTRSRASFFRRVWHKVAGLVAKPEDYYYSSARNYAEFDAPLEIIFESQQLTRY